MNIFASQLEKTLGIRRQNSLPTNKSWRTDVDFLLEDFQCKALDTYMIEGQEGSEVPPFACSFCPEKNQGHILAVADEDGCVLLYDTWRCGPIANIHEWLAHQNAIFDLAWVPGNKQILTASGDQTVALWDVVSEEKLDTFKGHTSSVKSIAVQPNNGCVFATSSHDGSIIMWDRRTNKKEVSQIKNVVRGAHTIKCTTKKKKGKAVTRDYSVTSVLYQDEKTLISSGAIDGAIKVWDIRKSYSSSKTEPTPMFKFNYGGKSARKRGFTSLSLDTTKSRLFVSCTDDVIYQYNCANYLANPVATYRGHQNTTFYVKSALSPDDNYLITGSSDYHVYIYNVKEPNKSPVLLKGHEGEVTSVAWCPTDFYKIASLSDDCTVRFWRLKDRSQSSEPDHTQLVGIAERVHRDIGVTADSRVYVPPTTGQLSKPFTSPPSIPTQSLSYRTMSILPPSQFHYPDLKAWLENLNKKSPRKPPPASPRKLLLSPRKSLNVGLLSPTNVGVKRKFDNDENQSPLAKRLCPDLTLKVPSPKRLPLSPMATERKQTDAAVQKTPRCKIAFDTVDGAIPEPSIINKTPKRISRLAEQFASPTSNLPNSVLDKPHVTQTKEIDNSSASDWLQRFSGTPESPSDSSLYRTPKTPKSRSSTPGVNRTPSSARTRRTRNSNTPLKSHRSILQYFKKLPASDPDENT